MKCTAAIVSAILAFAAASPLDLPQGVESGAGAAVSSAAGSVPSLGALMRARAVPAAPMRYAETMSEEKEDKDKPKGKDKGKDEGKDKGKDKEMDKGKDKEMDKGKDKEMDKGKDKEMDKGIDKGKGKRDEDKEGLQSAAGTATSALKDVKRAAPTKSAEKREESKVASLASAIPTGLTEKRAEMAKKPDISSAADAVPTGLAQKREEQQKKSSAASTSALPVKRSEKKKALKSAAAKATSAV